MDSSPPASQLQTVAVDGTPAGMSWAFFVVGLMTVVVIVVAARLLRSAEPAP